MYAGSADQTADTTKRDIFENFKSYSLEKPELIRMDNHLLDRHLQFKSSETFAIDRSNTVVTATKLTAVVTTEVKIVRESGDSSSAPPQFANSPSSSSSSTSNNNNTGHSPSFSQTLSSSQSNVGSYQSSENPYLGMFDAIVTDPPYGIRAGAKKSGTVYFNLI